MNHNQGKTRSKWAIRAISAAGLFVIIFALLALSAFAADSASSYDAQFGELYYENLSDAIEAANSSASGGTVTVLRDVNLAECLTISKDVTLTGKYTIYRADSYTAGLFTVDAGVTLTLDGGITLDGGNEWVLDYDAFHTDIQKEEFLVSGMSYVTAEPSAPVATAHMISIYGSLVMNKATVQNNYGGTSLTTAPFRLYQGATLTMNDGAVARHNYIKGDSALVHCNSRYATWTINDGAEITENYSTGIGGLSFFYYSYVEMNGGEMHDNYVCGKEGSIFKLYNGARFTMNDGYIHDNYAFAMSGEWGGTISVHYTSDAATTGNYSTFTMNGGVVGPNYGNGRTTLVGNGYNKPLLYLNGGKVINVDGYNGVSGSYLYYTADSGVMEGGTIEGDSVDIRKDFTNNGTINSNVNLINKANATVYGNGVVNGNLYLDPDKNTVSACISGCTWNGDVILSDIANAVLSGGTYNGNIIVPDGATLSITGGQFKNSPVEYLAAGSQSFYDAETGLYTVYSGNVASFGGAEYATLAEAIAAANAVGGGEVALIRPTYLAESISVSSDITLSGAYSVVRSDSYTGNLFTVDAGATLTLDGGITIDGGNEWVLDYDTMYETMMSSPSSVDSLTFVTPEDNAPVATDYMFKVSGNVVMNNATVQNNYGKVLTSVFSVASGANVTLNSGAKVTHNASINVENTNKFNASVAYVAKGGVLVMNDGADISYNHMVGNNATLEYLHGDFIVNGGDIHNNSSINCGGLVVILDTTGVLTVNDGHIYENTNLVKNGANAAGAIFVYGASKFIMNGGLVEKNYSSGTTLIYAYSASTVELNGGTIRQEQRATHSGYSSYVAGAFTMGEDMTIEGGSIQIQKPFSTSAAFDCDVWLGGTSTVSNGTFNRDLRAVVSTTISGGTFLGNITVDSEKTLSIKGGRFKNDPSAYLADSHEAIYNEATGFYTVNKYYEASFGVVNYDSLEEAIAAANTAGGGEVTLLHDADLNTSITVSSDILLQGAYSVVRSDSYTGNLFTVDAGATLTLDGGITLDGGNEWVFKEALFNESYANNGVDISSLVYVTPETEAPIATAPICYISGTVIMNKATVKNHYAQSQNPPFVVSGGSLIMNDGALATENANTGGAAVVYTKAGGTFTMNDGVEICYNYSNAADSGIVYAIDSTITMNGGDVHHNYQTRCAGVFLDLDGTTTAVMNGGHIHDNTQVVIKGKVGGVIYTDAVSFTMNGGVIERNYSNGATCIYADVGCALYLNAGIIRQENRAVIDNYTLLTTGVARVGENMLIEGAWIRFSHKDFVIDGEISSGVQFRNITEAANITGVINGDIGFTGTINTVFSSGTYNGNFIIPTNTSIVISGGVYNGAFSVADGADFSIRGGLFKQDPSAYLADYHEVVYDEATGFYTVNKYYEASFGGANYDSLEEAIAAANTSGGEVTLLRDVYLDTSITVSSDILLRGAYSVVRSDSYTGTLFNVSAGATLTLDGGITIDGGNEWTLTDEFMIDLNAGIPVSRAAGYYVVPEAGAPVGSDYMIKIYGRVVVNNATVCNNYTTKNTAAAFYVAGGANLTTNNGAVLKDNCSTSNNPLINCAATGTWIINEGTEICGHYAGSNGGLSYMQGQVTMNGGDAHDNYLNCGAGTLFMLYGTGTLTMNGGHVHDNYNIPNGTSAGGVIYVHNGGGGGTFTMNGGVIEANHGINNTVITCSGDNAKVYLNGGVIRHEVSTNPDWTYDSQLRGTVVIGEDMLLEGGRIRIRCPEITIDGTVNSQIVSYLAQTTIKGSGTINGDVNIIDYTAFVIESGEWLGKINVAETGGLSITGGSFRENPTNWLADGYGAVYNPDSEMYGVDLVPVATIGETEYDTITEALDAAADGDVIKIAASHKIRESITVAKNVTIDTGNQTIIVDKSVAVAFVIKANTTFRGSGTVNTDNGNTAVFAIGDADTEGSLTIESGSYIGESTVASVENGSLNISGGDFSVNPDGTEATEADCADLIVIAPSGESAPIVSVTGGRFRSYNPKTAGEGFVSSSLDAIEGENDYYSILTHIFLHYISDGNATCTEDGTKTAVCEYCDLTDTVTEVGSKLSHVFKHYVTDSNATCTENGTRTAKCEGCDATDTVIDRLTSLGHSFTDYVPNGDATCAENGTKTAKCERCEETRTIVDGGTRLSHNYDGLKCTSCGSVRILAVILIAFACLAVFMFLPFLVI